MFKNKKNPKFAHCKTRISETKVRSGLAVTPSQVLKMAEQGIPVSSQLQYQMVEGHTGSDWSLNLEDQRGIDMGQVWQETMSAKKRLKAGAKAAVVEPAVVEPNT